MRKTHREQMIEERPPPHVTPNYDPVPRPVTMSAKTSYLRQNFSLIALGVRRSETIFLNVESRQNHLCSLETEPEVGHRTNGSGI